MGVVDNIQSGSNVPANDTSIPMDISSGAWIIIGLLIFTVVVLIIALFVMWHTLNKKIDKLRQRLSKDIDGKEFELLDKYRQLNDSDKTNIDVMISAMIKNSPKDEHKKE